MKRAIIFLFALCCLASALPVYAGHSPSGGPSDATALFQRADGFLRQAGIAFTENRGQIADMNGCVRDDIAYVATATGAKLFLRRNGITFVFTQQPASARAASGAIDRLDMTLVNSNPAARLRAGEMLPGSVNYYLQGQKDGITGVRQFSRIVYENVYDNIDFEVFSVNGIVKYNFIVRPGGRVGDIRMRYDGASGAALTAGGALSIATRIGGIAEAAPYSYTGREDRTVASRFLLDGNTVSFAVGNYDPEQTLVIDPWATYLGGSTLDACTKVAADASGNIYLVGYTNSTNFPVSAGAFQTNLRGTMDGFIAAFDAAGQRLWATYFGGSKRDWTCDVDVDGSGNVIVAGLTESKDFPVTAGAFQSSLAGGIDAYIAKINGGGSLLWATYYGGRSNDMRLVTDIGVGVDGNGDIAFTGTTVSTDFPVTAGAFQTRKAKGTLEDAYLVKLNAAGTRLWATYYGGTGLDFGRDVAFDESNDIYFVGGTYSTNFPVSSGCFQSSSGGGGDAFVVKFTAGGGRSWATYCGGSGDDGFDGAVIGPSGSLLAAGAGGLNFPVTAGTYQSQYAGGGDAVVAMFAAAGSRTWATYLGGTGNEGAHGIDLDANGDIAIAGATTSSNFPVVNAMQGVYGNNVDAFMAKLDGAGTTLLWSTYYGGSGNDYGSGVVAAGGCVTMVGSTGSANFTTYNPFQAAPGGGGDGMIVQLNSSGQFAKSPATAQPLPVSVVLEQNYPNPCSGTTQLAFSIPEDMHVIMTVCDALGREVDVLENGSFPAGRHTLRWSADSRAASGVYLLRLVAQGSAAGAVVVERSILLKK